MFKIYKIGELGEQTIRSIVEIKDKIDFFPVYQRYGNIWDTYKQKLLIDTILNGFDIPKFYFNYFIDTNNPLNRNNKIYAVIDGKQRIQAMLDFIADKFPLDNEFEYFDNSDIRIAGLKYSQIAERFPEVISKFFECALDIIFVSTDDEDMLEELFLRLNGGAALTNAEKRNAIGGYFNEQVRAIVESEVFFTEKVRFKNPRYQHQDLLTKIIFVESRNDLVSLKNNELSEFVRNNRQQSINIDSLLSTVVHNLSILSDLFENKDFLLRAKGIIPVFYFFQTRFNPNPRIFRDFLSQFETLRQENRQLEESASNPTLIEFDRMNQQGVHMEKSLKRRLEIIQKFYEMFEQNGHLEINQVSLPSIDSDEELEDQ